MNASQCLAASNVVKRPGGRLPLIYPFTIAGRPGTKQQEYSVKTYTVDELRRYDSTVVRMIAETTIQHLTGPVPWQALAAVKVLAERARAYSLDQVKLGCRCLACPNRARVPAPESTLAPMVDKTEPSRQLIIGSTTVEL